VAQNLGGAEARRSRVQGQPGLHSETLSQKIKGKKEPFFVLTAYLLRHKFVSTPINLYQHLHKTHTQRHAHTLHVLSKYPVLKQPYSNADI
jgi:hypothetical protein